MKKVVNKILDRWMSENRFNCQTLASSLNKLGTNITTQTVWEWVVNGRIPYAKTIDVIDKLIKNLGDNRTKAESLFAFLRKKPKKI